jgi:hypothetical protein
MLVRVGMDSESLVELASKDSLEMRASQRLLVGQLTQCAVLIYANSTDRQTLTLATSSLPQELRRIWTAGLGQIVSITSKTPIVRALSEILDTQQLLEWAGKITLALVSNQNALRFALQTNVARIVDNASNIEVTRVTAADSTALQAALTIQRTDVGTQQDRDNIWAERFYIAASTGQPITILDRYAVVSLAKTLNQGTQNGLCWFLDKIATTTDAPVHLITSAAGRSAAGGVVANLQRSRQRLTGSGVQTLSVTLAATKHFAQRSHPRHLRFGNIAVGLDRGLSMFDSPCCPHSMPCTIADRNAARSREEEIEHQAFPDFRRLVVW